jgi:hypothetical protein
VTLKRVRTSSIGMRVTVSSVESRLTWSCCRSWCHVVMRNRSLRLYRLRLYCLRRYKVNDDRVGLTLTSLYNCSIPALVLIRRNPVGWRLINSDVFDAKYNMLCLFVLLDKRDLVVSPTPL